MFRPLWQGMAERCFLVTSRSWKDWPMLMFRPFWHGVWHVYCLVLRLWRGSCWWMSILRSLWEASRHVCPLIAAIRRSWWVSIACSLWKGVTQVCFLVAVPVRVNHSQWGRFLVAMRRSWWVCISRCLREGVVPWAKVDTLAGAAACMPLLEDHLVGLQVSD